MMPRILLLTVVYTMIMSCHQTQKNPILKSNQAQDMHFAIGTYTKKEGHVDGKASGIYIGKLNEKELSIEIVDSLIGIKNPSYVTINGQSQRLYAVSETDDDLRSGTIKGYGYDAEWNFQELNQESTHCNAPCHLTISSDQEHIT